MESPAQSTPMTVDEPSLTRPSITAGSGTPGQRGRAPGLKGRAWTLTINNYSDSECDALCALECQRIIVGKEIGKVFGTPHLQAYVRFKEPCRDSWLKTRFPRAHIELARGKDSINEAYCSKDGNVVCNRGVNQDDAPVSKMSRDDETDMIIAEIESGAKYGQIRNKHKRFCFWHRRNVLDYMFDQRTLLDEPDRTPI